MSLRVVLALCIPLLFFESSWHLRKSSCDSKNKKGASFLMVARGYGLECSQPYAENSVFSCDDEVEKIVGRLFKTTVGYTLIGKKPVSEGDWPFFNRASLQQEQIIREFLVLAFKNSRSFILQLQANTNYCFPFVLIHKPALIKVINENKELSDFVIKKFATTDRLFSHLKNSGETLFKTFEFNDFLLGLILGYGRSNSEYFCRRGELSDLAEMGQTPPAGRPDCHT